MNKKSLFSICYLSLGLITAFSTRSFGELFDTDALTSGLIPSNVKLETADIKKAEFRVTREFAPSLKIDPHAKGPWDLTFGNAEVQSGQDYTLIISLASVGSEVPQSSPQIVIWDSGNLPSPGLPPEDREGCAVLSVESQDGSNSQILASIPLSPMTWTTSSITFTVPGGVTKISPKLSGIAGGTFFIADLKLTKSDQKSEVYLPEKHSLDLLTNKIKEPFVTKIEPGKKYGFYSPGEEITWNTSAPSDSYKNFKYKIISPLGEVYKRGSSDFPGTVTFKPDRTGFYELDIQSVSNQNPSSIYYDRQGAAVMAPMTGLVAGGNPFGGQSCPFDLAHKLGMTWVRQGLFGYSEPEDINQIAADKDYSTTITAFKTNQLLPLHSSYNIAAKTNSTELGNQEQLPSDAAAYGESYRKLVGLGNNFVTYFEFWNEPEQKLGSSLHWTMSAFTKDLKAAYQGMKQANPRAKMLLEGSMEVFKGVDSHDGDDAYDIAVIHPYAWNVGNNLWNTPEEGLQQETCASTRQFLDSHHGKNKEIWSTEYGYTTGPTTCGCSELQQAQMLVRSSLLQLAGGVVRINPFRMDDVWFWGAQDGRFGLCRENMTPKPSMVSYGAMIRALRSLPFQGRLKTEKNIAALIFGDDKECVVPIWTDRDDTTISLQAPAGTTAMNLWGQIKAAPAGSNSYSVDQSVQYLLVPVGFQKFNSMQSIPFLAGNEAGIFDINLTTKSWGIPVLPQAPVVDGNLDEWQGPAIELVEGESKASVRVAISGSNFYLMAQVRGGSPGENKNEGTLLWNGDCVELYFTKESENRTVGFLRSSDRHFGIAPGVDGSNGKIASLASGRLPTVEGAKVSYVKKAGGGYDLEASVPLSALGLDQVHPNDRYGFDIQLDVGAPSADARLVQATWAGSGTDSSDPLRWGSAFVVPAE